MSSLEIIAVLLGLANIILLVRRSIWNYPFGIAMVVLYAWIFYGAKLYSDALLQIFFFVVQIYGWWNWANAAQGTDDKLIPLLRMTKPHQLAILGGIIALGIAWGTMMARYTDAHYPYWDGTIAMTSVVAQLLLARRYLENWVLWIIVDLLAIGLYWTKGLQLTAGLYVIFLFLSGLGLYQWARNYRQQQIKGESAPFH